MKEMYGEPEPPNTGESNLTRAGTALAAIVIVGLLFLCLRFALDAAGGDRRGGAATVAPPRSVVSAAPTAAPAARPDPGFPGVAPRRAPVLSPYAARPHTAPPPMPAPTLPVPQGDPIFASAEEQQAVRAFLKEMRSTYEAARRLGGDSGGAASAAVVATATPRAAPTAQAGRVTPPPPGDEGATTASADAVRNGDVPLERYVPAGEVPDAAPTLSPAEVRAQSDALGVLVALNAHPARFPAPLQDDVRDFAREMRAFLATMSLAATASPEEAGAYRAAAAPRLVRASVLLHRMEDMAKTGVAPTRPRG